MRPSPTHLLKSLQALFAPEKIFLVGGAVRDLALRRPLEELDFCTSAPPAKTRKILHKAASDFNRSGETFGTVACACQGWPVQITTFRAESYDGKSRKPKVAYLSNLKADLSRRDFTVNSMAWDGEKVHDPFGGKEDLRRRLIRFTGDPAERIAEDPLRMLRAVRFAAVLTFRIEEASLRAIRDSAGELARVSKERIRQELDKLLLAEKPSVGLNLLYETKLYEPFLPMDELILDPLPGVHHKDVFKHTLKVVDNCPPELVSRWACLLHDFGKKKTRGVVNNNVHFFGHEAVSEKIARRVLTELRYPKQFVDDVCLLVYHHLYLHGYGAEGNEWTDSAVRRFVRTLGELRPAFLQMARSDITSSNPRRVKQILARLEELEQRIKRLEEEEEIQKIKPILDGNEIMTLLDIPPGPLVGKAKSYVFERQMELGPSYSKEQAVEEVRQRFSGEARMGERARGTA